jgi:hypothetical protein
MVEIESRTLRTLQEDPLTADKCFIDLDPRIDREGEDPLPERHAFVELRRQSRVLPLPQGGKALEGPLVTLLEQSGKASLVQGIDDTDSAASNFLLVCRTDPPSGRPDLLLGLSLRRHIEGAMIGEKEVGATAHPDPPCQIDPTCGKRVILLKELDQVENDAIPEEAPLPRVEDPGRDLMEDEALLANLHRVPGIGAALIAGHNVHLLRQDVDNLPLPLVAPLGTDDDYAVAIRSSTLHFDLLLVDTKKPVPGDRPPNS